MSLLPLPISINLGGLGTLLFSALEHVEADVAESLLGDLIDDVVPATTTIGFSGGNWFASVSHLLFPVEELVVAPLLFAATIGAVLRQDMRRLARAWAVGLPLSLLAGYAIVELAQWGLSVTDALSSLVQDQVEPNLQTDFLGAVSSGITAAVSTGPIGAVVSLLVIIGGVLIWLELALRSAALELAVFFMPLALAGLVWPATAHWAKRLGEVLVALLVAKPVMVGALCLGANALTSAQRGPESVVTGSAILLLAGFAPMALLKLVPMAEASVAGPLQDLSRQPFRAAERAVHTALSVVTRAAVAGGAGGEPGGVGVGAGQMLGQVSRHEPLSEAERYGPAAPPPQTAPRDGAALGVPGPGRRGGGAGA